MAQESQSLLAGIRTLVEQLPMSAIIYKLEGTTPLQLRIAYVNERIKCNTDQRLATGVGRYLHDVIPDLMDAKEMSRIDVAQDGVFWGMVRAAKGEQGATSYMFTREVGTIEHTEVHLIPLPDSHVAAVYEDVTERVLTQRSLEESEERFRSTFEQVAIGIAHVNLQGEFIRANKACIELFGYPEEELLSRTFQSITYPKDLTKGHKALRQLKNGDIDYASLEKRYIKSDGDILWAKLTSCAVKDEEGKIKHLASVIEDITERKRIEESIDHHLHELQRSNRDLTEFVNVTAHGLQAPLDAIEAQVRELEQSLHGSLQDSAQQSLEQLHRRIRQISNRLSGMQRYARVGRTRQKLETSNVAGLLSSLIDQLPIPPGFSITNLPMVNTITTHTAPLVQVLQNLLMNACIHHNRETGQIKISAKQREDGILFGVFDDGPGIAPQYHEKIFEPFFQISPQTPGSSKSSGAGLSIAKKLVQQQGGKIWVESKPGKGAEFYFLWPEQYESK